MTMGHTRYMKNKQNKNESGLRETCDSPMAEKAPVRQYEVPELVCYGDVRDVTLGGSIGLGESGSTPFDPRRP